MNPTNLTKRGMHTSKDMAQANLHIYQPTNPQHITQTRKEYIVTNIESSKPNIIINKAHNLTTDQLNQTKYINSLGIHNGRPEYHFNYNNVAHSNFVPPPPSKFLVSSGYNHSINSQTSQLPINSNHVQTVQTVQNVQTFQPLHQSIRKTYVPHHIYNEIPIMNTQTKYVDVYHQSSSAQQAKSDANQNQIDEAEAKMLQQYEKLYSKYQEQCLKSQTMERRIKQLQQQIIENDYQSHQSRAQQPQIKQIIHTKQVYVNRPAKVDVNLLASLLMKKLKPQITNSFQRKKASCINKLKLLISDHQSAIKTTMIRSYDQISVKVQHR